jgi:hypothetical protein
MTIALLMFIRDEEKSLPRCFANLQSFDQYVIAVDDRTIDKSEDWLKSHDLPFHRHHFLNDFSASYNLEIKKCTTDWIFVLAPDEVINFKLDFMDDEYDIYAFPRQNWYDLEMIKGFELGGEDFQGRLFRNNGKIWWQGRVHEQLCGFKNMKYLDNSKMINHFAPYYENIEPERLKRKLDMYKSLGEVGYRLKKCHS